MNRVTISLTPSVARKARQKVEKKKGDDQRFSFSRYVEELLRADLRNARPKRKTARRK